MTLKKASNYRLRRILKRKLLIGPNHVRELNQSGVFIWNCLDNKCTELEILKSLKEKYPKVSEQVLTSDLRLFLAELSSIDAIIKE